jgi:hypothetical protein
VALPSGAALGVGQVLAVSADGSIEYDRAWFLHVINNDRD